MLSGSLPNLLEQVVAIGSTLLKRLRLYAVTAETTEVAEQLVRGHMSGGSQLLTSAQVSKLINTLSTHLVDLSEELMKSDEPTSSSAPNAALAQKQGARQIVKVCCWLQAACNTLCMWAAPKAPMTVSQLVNCCYDQHGVLTEYR